jgi:hypothetical protein
MSTHPVWVVARNQAMRSGLPMIGGYWAIMAVIYAFILTLAVALAEPDVSIWATSGGSAPKYFMAAIGIMMTAVFLQVYIGQGVTRRHFALGASAYLAAVAVVYALVMTLGYTIEHAIYAANDLLARQTDPYPVLSIGDGFGTFLEETCVGVIYLLAGWLTGSWFYRFGVWAIALLPVAVLPIAATEMAFDSLWLGFGLNNALGIDPPSSVGVPVTAACAAVVWAANYALLRGIAIKKVSG